MEATALNIERSLRVLCWNLRHGGGTRRMPEIVLGIAGHEPDVVVLTEFRGASGGNVRAMLADRGLEVQLIEPGREGQNRVMIASRWKLETPRGAATEFPGGRHRWLFADVPELGIGIAGVHVPDDTRRAEKLACWHFLVEFARKNAGGRCMVAGDFNSGRKGADAASRLAGTPLLGTFCSLGMTDAWRSLHPRSAERSWNGSRGESSRIDAIFVTEPMRKSLCDAYFSHREREAGFSDHSPLIACFRGDFAPTHPQVETAGGLLFGRSDRPTSGR